MSCGNLRLLLLLLSVIFTFAAKGALGLKSELLCNQCSGCETIKCPPTESYPHMTAHDDSLIAGALTVDQQGKVRLRSLSSLDDLGDADWKSFNPPKELNHREFRYWVNRRTGKCLTVLPNGKAEKHVVGIADCRFDGSNPFQLFAFRFHYHKAFC